MFSFFRKRRRRKILAEPFPAEWQTALHEDVRLYRTLDRADKAKLRDDLRIFIAEHAWEAARGFDLTDRKKVIIASQACLLTLGFDDVDALRARSILVVPTSYEMRGHRMGDGPIVSEGFRAAGHTSPHGPVVLSWMDVMRDTHNPEDGRNVVLHEFAHRLDMCDGLADGVPPVHNRAQYQRWQEILTESYEQLKFDTEVGMRTVLRSYGATDPVEFFAVSTEIFFEKPRRLKLEHPELYDVLREFYRQDPARRRG
jgi:Mlc titration factor MtfA (ptsG expression regulator)